ncbi:MAG: hypothetical protein WHT63_05575, partial [Tepidiforma sp.]
MLRPPSPAVTRVAAAAFGLILAAGAALLVAPVAGLRSDLAEGDYAPRTFEAAHDAQFVSEALTEAAREQAAAAVAQTPQDVYVGAGLSLRDYGPSRRCPS